MAGKIGRRAAQSLVISMNVPQDLTDASDFKHFVYYHSFHLLTRLFRCYCNGTRQWLQE